MPNYMRPRISGVPVFFTVALAQLGGNVLMRELAALREALAVTRAGRPVGVAAWVVMPDHLHALWTMPEGDADYSTQWGGIPLCQGSCPPFYFSFISQVGGIGR